MLNLASQNLKPMDCFWQAPAAGGPVLAFPLGERAGAPQDMVAGRIATLSGSPSWAAGPEGPELVFASASSQYASLGDLTELDTVLSGAYGVRVRFRMTTASTVKRILGKGLGLMVVITNYPVAGMCKYYTGASADGSALDSTGTPALNDGIFHDVWFVRRVAASVTQEIWVDGKLDASRTEVTAPSATADEFRFGQDGSAFGGHFDGSISLVEVYPYAPEGGEILARTTYPWALYGCDLWPGVSAATAVLLAGIAYGEGDSVAALQAERRLSALAQGDALARAELQLSRQLAGVSTAAVETLAAAQLARQLAGLAWAESSDMATLTTSAVTAVLLEGLAYSSSSVQAALQIDRQLAGLAPGSAEARAGVQIDRMVSAVSYGLSQVAAAAQVDRQLTCRALCESVTRGDVQVARALTGLAQATSETRATLINYLAAVVQRRYWATLTRARKPDGELEGPFDV